MSGSNSGLARGDICRTCFTRMEEPGSGSPREHDICARARAENWAWLRPTMARAETDIDEIDSMPDDEPEEWECAA